MANEFKIKKGLIVDGTGTVLEVKAGNSTLLSVNDTTDGSLFAVPNADGFAILSISGSSVEMGLLTSQGTRPLTVASGKVYMTGSAYLTDLRISGSLVQGPASTATGKYSHAQGDGVLASGDYSHAEGEDTKALGPASHAEGSGTTATGIASHAEGNTTLAFGIGSHAEGDGTIATGNYSHAEGLQARAVADYSHAQGNNTIAQGWYQHVIGQFNEPKPESSAFILGNGTEDGNRSNLIYAYGSGSNGVVEINGNLVVVGGSIIGATIQTTPVSSSTNTGIHTLGISDIGKIILFRNNCTASIQPGLPENFECTIVSVAGKSVRFQTGSGVTLLNNTEMTLPSKLSVTIKKIGSTDEFITNGGL